MGSKNISGQKISQQLLLQFNRIAKGLNLDPKVERFGEMPVLEDLWNMPDNLQMKGEGGRGSKFRIPPSTKTVFHNHGEFFL